MAMNWQRANRQDRVTRHLVDHVDRVPSADSHWNEALGVWELDVEARDTRTITEKIKDGDLGQG